ncbi:MAG TPA: hypothetical protein VFM02_01350 [Candidatus Paceibacterota bacterium]|nr:hypothetical protein [Candidatus Paceibacterota bacterium]
MAKDREGEAAPLPGITQWVLFGNREMLERTVAGIKELRPSQTRILISWADWGREGATEWFDEMLERLAETSTELIPALFYTPPDQARKDENGEQRTSHPPEDLTSYTRYVEMIIERYGKHFSWVQLWNEPNWKPYWEWDLDPEWKLFAQMVTPAAQRARALGKRVALGGLSPYEPEWMTLMHRYGLTQHLDAVGINFSPSWSSQRRRWFGWALEVESAKAHLRGLGLSNVQLWAAEPGFATPAENETQKKKLYQEQIEHFEEVRHSGADNILWYSLLDLPEEHKTDDQVNMSTQPEQAANHFGIITAIGEKKPLYHHWKRLADQRDKGSFDSFAESE